MSTTTTRHTFRRLLALLLLVTAGSLAALTTAQPASAQPASPGPATAQAAADRSAKVESICGEYVRLYNAATNEFIGTDFNRGTSFSVSRFQNIFFFGDNLLPSSVAPRPFFRFLNTLTGEVRTYEPGVSDNGVMRDDNRNYRNRITAGSLLFVGLWQVDAAYFAECGVSDVQFLGFIQVN